MGCGCGKRTSTRTTSRVVSQTTAPTVAPNASRTEVAKTYQSATIRTAPTGPVGTARKTV